MRYPLFALFLLLPACSPPPTPATDISDELVSDGADGWFVLRRDERKCASPMCGGWFVTRPNRARTTCANGTRARECYVAALDWSETKFSQDERAKLSSSPAVFHGRFVDGSYPTGTYANLAVADVWSPAVAPALVDGYPWIDGTLYRAFWNGIVCIRAPCPTTSQETLNRGATRLIDGVDFSATCANDRQVDEAIAALGTRTGVVVDGDDFRTFDESGAPTLVAWNFYLQVVPAP